MFPSDILTRSAGGIHTLGPATNKWIGPIPNVGLFYNLGPKWHSIRVFIMVFSILPYFTILKSYFINYIIPFYNTSNIPKLYFFILFKYSFLIFFLPFLFFYFFSSLSPSTSSKPILCKITTKNHPNQTSTKNPPATLAKSQQKNPYQNHPNQTSKSQQI